MIQRRSHTGGCPRALGWLLVALFVFVAAAAAFAEGGVEFTEEQMEEENLSIWTGERLAFAKADGADPTVEANQDRITESVWITRANDGGQIFNIAQSDDPSKEESPVGTLWAEGTTDEITDLSFAPFREAVVKPRSVVGKDYVLFIIEEGIFIDVTFTGWSREKLGGFSYERSTPN